MPAVGVNQEPLKEALMFAFNDTDYRVVKCDANGQILAAIATGQSIEVTQDTEANLKAIVSLDADENVQARLYGYNGSDWHKSGQILSRSAAWDVNLGGTATGVTYNKTTVAVPANWLYVLSACSFANITEAGTLVLIYVDRASGARVYLAYAATLAQYAPLIVTGNFVLEAGDTLSVYSEGTNNGNVIISGLCGYKMQLNA